MKYSHKKRNAIYDTKDRPIMYYAKGNKADRERQILNYFIYM